MTTRTQWQLIIAAFITFGLAVYGAHEMLRVMYGPIWKGLGG